MPRSTLYCILFIAIAAAPSFGQVRAGIQTGPEVAVPSPLSQGGSAPGFVNFDDGLEPCTFASTVAVTTEFAAFGVTFSGPGGNDGGAVLDECSNFDVTGYSSPNFLAFNENSSLSDGGIPRGPETMTFAAPTPTVTINCGIGSSVTGTVTLECFDAGAGSLGSDVINVATALQPLTVAAAGIVSCELSYALSAPALVCDDLQFETMIPVEVIEFEVD